jgi:ferritin-like metal-binding protein YciE
MGIFTKSIKTMDDLFLHVVQDVYYAEKQTSKALPDLIEKATNRGLTAALKEHLAGADKQASRLEQVFDLLGEKPKGTSCPAIDGILKEARDIAGDVADRKILDAAILAATQAIDHYRTTRYGTLATWSREMGKLAVARMLSHTLADLKQADAALTRIGAKKVNLKAVG